MTVLLVSLLFWGVKLVELQRSIDGNAAYWSAPRGQSGGLLYVALGDSAAQSIGASEPAKGYVGIIAQRLAASRGQPVKVINLSRSGARIDDVLDRQLAALKALDQTPDVVTIAIGGNDIRAYDQQTFSKQVERLTVALPAGTYIADAPYFMHGRWERDARQAADLLVGGAEANNLQPVPLHEALKAQGGQAMFTQFAADWFHPNDRGHKVWADTFWREISQNLPDNPSR